MAHCISVVGRICRAGALASVVAVVGLTGKVAAQQPPPKKGAAAPAAAAAAGHNSFWVKLCDKESIGTMYVDNKEETRYRSLCLTQHERIDGTTGVALMTAAVRQMEGEGKQYLSVTVPLGMTLKAGMRGVLYPKDAWEPAQRNEKIDETKLKGLKLEYQQCHPAGCTAQVEATPELIDDLKKFAGVAFFAINAQGEALSFPVPLAGFEKAYTGNPTDPQQYVASRKALMQQIAQRQKALAEQQKKKAAQPAAATAAPPAKQ